MSYNGLELSTIIRQPRNIERIQHNRGRSWELVLCWILDVGCSETRRQEARQPVPAISSNRFPCVRSFARG